MAAPAREMFYKMKCKMDPFVEDIGRNFNGKTPLFDVNYDLDVLLSIVRVCFCYYGHGVTNLGWIQVPV